MLPGKGKKINGSLFFAVVTGVVLCMISGVTGQTMGGPAGSRKWSDTRQGLPEYAFPEQAPGIVLPAPPPSPEKAPMPDDPVVRVNRYRFSGNTVISDDELRAISAPYTGRLISNGELQALRYKLTTHYVSKGYINSGAVLPDQKIENGIIRFDVIEGRLTDLEITGTKSLEQTFIRNELNIDPEAVLNIFTLRKQLQQLHRIVLIEKVNAELIPGMRPGQAVLKLAVSEADPVEVRLRYKNHSPPSSGSRGPELVVRHHNLTGQGDALMASYNHTEGADEVYVEASLPVNTRGTRLSLFYDYTESRLVEEPFHLIDITGNATSLGVSMTHPLVKSGTHELLLGVTGENRSSRTYLFDEPYAFAENSENGEVDINVGRFSVHWNYFQRAQVLSVRSVISKGVDIFDASEFDTEPDADFLTWLFQFQWARRLDVVNGDQLILKGVSQLSNDPLPAMEKISVGGRTSVRGYRENQMVRDNGIIVSAEYRIPLFRLPLFSTDLDDGMVRLAPFADWGRAWNTDSSDGADIISSVGAGLRWDPGSGIRAEIYYGKGLQDANRGAYDLQDDGIHFFVEWRF